MNDDYGLSIGTTSDAARTAYVDGVGLMLAAWPGADGRLDAATAADPGFALAHAARARLHAMFGDGPAARRAISRAADLSAGASERERSHIEILRLAITGASRDALRHALDHVDRWPRDVIILSLPLGAFGLLAFSGMADHDAARANLVERHARHFASDDWWFLTYRGWAHVEYEAVSNGRAMIERSMALKSSNANGAHALSHALFEAGAIDETTRLIDTWLPGYHPAGILHGHIAWHAALAALDRGDVTGAFEKYHRTVRPSVSRGMPINVASDAASFLWRLAAYGHPVPQSAWQEIAHHSAAWFPSAGHAFVDLHMAMIEAMSDVAAFGRRLAALETLVEREKPASGPVSIILLKAILAFSERDDARVISLLTPAMADVARVGGSRAQREVIEDTLLASLMRAGEATNARELLDRRLHRRPSPRDERWRSHLPLPV